MNLQTYIPLALRTEAPPQNVLFNLAPLEESMNSVSQAKSIVSGALNIKLIRTLHAVMGLATEVGELLQAYNDTKKMGKMDRVNVAEEIGDCFWYMAIFIDAWGFDVSGFSDRASLDTKGRVGRMLRHMSVDASILMDECKRALFYGKDFNCDRLVSTFSSLYTRLMLLCRYFNHDPNSVRETNIAKLSARYPDKFNNVDAVNRDLESERKVLEGGS